MPQQFADFHAVHFGQHEIKHDQAGLEGARLFQGFRAIRSRGDVKAGLLQIELHQFHRLRLVIHHQDFLFHFQLEYHVRSMATILCW